MTDEGSKIKEVSLLSFLSRIRYEHLVAGLTGGVISTLVTHPFDLIKLRFAVHDGIDSLSRPKYRGLLHASSSIIREDGFFQLYRVFRVNARITTRVSLNKIPATKVPAMQQGASANVAGAGASWGFYFFFYNAFKFHIQGGDLNRQLSATTNLLCATCAGVLTLTLTNPIWVVKTRLCLTNTENVPHYMQYRGLREGLVNLYRYEGVRGLYKGYVPGLLGTSHGAVQFMVYEELKKTYCNFYQIPISTQLGALEYISMAAISKVVAVSTTYPYQVVRARLQDQDQKYRGVTDTTLKITRHEGVRGFYKGLIPSLAKVVPATCITFVVYEYLSALLLRHR